MQDDLALRSPDARHRFPTLPLLPKGFTMAARITVDAPRSFLRSRGLPSHGRKADLLQRCRANRVALSPGPEIAGPAPSGTPPGPLVHVAPAPPAQAHAALDGGAGSSDPRPAPVSSLPLADAVRVVGAAAGALSPVDPFD